VNATARRADLVVVAVRREEGETTDDRAVAYSPFDVREVLKGSPSGARILVATRYGMCPYGVDVEPMVPSLLFLETHGDRYEPVRGGCAIKSLPVVNGKVVVDEISLSLPTLAAELGFRSTNAAPAGVPRKWANIGLLCLAAGVGLAAGVWLGRRGSNPRP
jgi:hypothetical protein